MVEALDGLDRFQAVIEGGNVTINTGLLAQGPPIGTDGMARDFRLVRGLGLGLDEAGVRAIQTWRFQPAVKDGHPVAAEANIEVNFRLL